MHHLVINTQQFIIMIRVFTSVIIIINIVAIVALITKRNKNIFITSMFVLAKTNSSYYQHHHYHQHQRP